MHGVRAIEDEDTPASLRLEKRSTLDGTKLADAEHGPRDWILQTHRVRNHGPYVGVRFDQERNAFDGGSVGPLAAVRESLFDQRAKVCEQADPAAGIALTAKIIGEPLAVGGLREHSGEREFSHSARPGKEHGVRDAFTRKHAAEGGYNVRIA